jgi:N-methylhydantoinase B/oxoprolinase/acetone carboxylase alpha subunit
VGLAGGEPGAAGENGLLPGGDESRAERLPDNCTIQLKGGDVVRMLAPGGGGWGASPDAWPPDLPNPGRGRGLKRVVSRCRMQIEC